jgi:hypothetical protein
LVIPNIDYKHMQILPFLNIKRFWKVSIAPHIHVNKLKRTNMLLWFLPFFWGGIYMFNKVFLSWQWSSMLLKPWFKYEPLHLIRQIQSLLILSCVSNKFSMLLLLFHFFLKFLKLAKIAMVHVVFVEDERCFNSISFLKNK